MNDVTNPAGERAAGDQATTHENSPLAQIVERNIETLVALKRHRNRQRNVQDRAADAITGFSGSMAFVYIHVILFAGWMILGNGMFGLPTFDPYPYQLLTMAVSLEAIFLSTFVLVSQNRMAKDADQRADLDLHIDLLTEHEMTRALKMLDAIQDKLGIVNDEDRELRELENEVTPTAVLTQLERAEARRDL